MLSATGSKEGRVFGVMGPGTYGSLQRRGGLSSMSVTDQALEGNKH